MKSAGLRTKPGRRLRRQAEQSLKKTPREGSARPAGDLQKLVHELQVHEVELEMQNDELRRIQAELETSRDRFADLYDFAPVAYVTLDAEGVVQQANLTSARLLGVDREQLRSRKLTSFVAAESQDAFYLHRHLTLTSGVKQTCELTMRRKDGSTFYAEAQTIAEGHRHGRPPQWLMAFSDRSALKQAEHALRKGEQELWDFFDQCPLGLLWVGPKGRILRCNRAALELLDHSQDDLQDRPISECLVDHAAGDDLVRRLARRETVENWRMLVRRKDGTITHVLVDANGRWEKRLVHSRWFVRDITRRIELEREILAISEREQQRLGRDLHDDLCQQLAGLEFLAGSLAKDLTHQGKARSDQAREIAQLARLAMDQTREMARGLSPVALEAGGLVKALRALAERIERVFRRRCRFRGTGTVQVADHAVALHFYRIAQEAVGNAIKHGQARRIEIVLKASGDEVILAVSDDGIGLPHKASPRKGMGLRVMQYRAGVMGGALVVERKPAGGTRVICTVKHGLLPP